MKAFHNDPAIKQKYLERVRAHRALDEIVKGIYWENGKGCAVGCTVHSNSHESYEIELGIPMILARLEDGIFESLPNELAVTWPERFLDAIPIGANLSDIWPQFAIWMLTDSECGVLRFARTEKSKEVIQNISDLYQRKLHDEEISLETWQQDHASAASAAYAAYAAYAYAAYAYAAYAYAYAADAAADASAAYAADAANASAAYAADASAASAAYAADASAASAADAANASAAYAAYAADAANASAADAKIRCRIAQSEKLLKLLGGAS